MELGKAQEAADWLALRRACRQRPRPVQLQPRAACFSSGRLDEAGRALQSALEIDPHNPDHLLALGDHYLRRGRARDAAGVADRLIAVAPGQPANNCEAAAERARTPRHALTFDGGGPPSPGRSSQRVPEAQLML